MRRILFFLIMLINLQLSSAYDIPPGGTNMIADALTNFTKIGGPGTINVINVDHEEFDKALRINVTSLPDNPWNFQVRFKPVEPLASGDVCLLSVWARCTYSQSESGEGILTPIIEHNQTYEKPLNKALIAGGDWVHFVYPFVADQDLSLSEISISIFVGHAVQTIEIADIQYLNYKNTIDFEDLPKMEITYDGMAEDAPWRAAAADRIEKFRKGDINVQIIDESENPVSNASVKLTMKKHLFGFGSAVVANTYNNNSTYREHVNELFNEVVFENDLKWKPWASTNNHAYIMTAINTLTNNGIRIRGHNLVWPGWNYLPSYLETNKNDGEYLKSESLKHIEEIATFTKGKLVDWDVLNEPYTNHVIQDVAGDQVMIDWFKKIREVDPDVKRYINDYSILSNGGTDKNHQDGYFDVIKYIDENGGAIQGIGMQGHFSEFVTGIPKLIEILDRFSTFQKEIKITEFDIDTSNDTLKVNYTRDFMTALFSYPYVKGILTWGFWAGAHWRPSAAYYNLDWSIRPQGEMYKKLVFDDWWTKEQNIVTNSEGWVDFGSCFLGTYEFEVEHDGKVITKSIDVNYNLDNEIIINIDNESVTINGTLHEDTPVFTSISKFHQMKKIDLQVYPNPATSVIHVKIDGVDTINGELEILNVSGNCVYKENVLSLNTTLLLPAQISRGIYFLSYKNDEHRITKRFIVN